MTRELSYLRLLETEAIFVMREVAAELERPVLLFSARFPFPIMHVDTGHNFPEVIEFRDRRVTELGERLIVASVQETIDTGRAVEETGPGASRNRLQTTTLLDAIAADGFDAALGGAPRDEERARAKERVFPLSNWTELDVWRYSATERLEVPPIYFAHERSVIDRDGLLLADSEFVPRKPGEEPFAATVRYRTVGDMAVTGAVRSEADNLEVCEQRDPKGLYRRARAGTLHGLTGVDDPYEPPADADLVLDGTRPVQESAEALEALLRARGLL